MDKNDVNNLIRILNKILQAFYIWQNICYSNKVLTARRNILENIDQFTANPQSYKKDIAILKHSLEYEERLVKIISKEEKKGENNLLYAIRVLKSYHHTLFNAPKFKQSLQINRELKKFGLSFYDLEKICIAAIKFLEYFRDEVAKAILYRIEVEKKFIDEPNKVNLDMLSHAWSNQADYDKSLLAIIQDIYPQFHKVEKITPAMVLNYAAQYGVVLVIVGGISGAGGAGIEYMIRGGSDIGWNIGIAFVAIKSVVDCISKLKKGHRFDLNISEEYKLLIKRIEESEGSFYRRKKRWYQK